MKKIFAIVAILLLTGLLLACSGGADAPATTTGVTNAPPPADLNLYVEGATEYKIVRGQRSSNGVKSIMADLHQAFKEQFGVAPNVSDDWVKDEALLKEDACEILLGDTNRLESIELKKKLPAGHSYAIATEGKRVVIVASSEAVLAKAVEVFVQDYVKTGAQGKNFTLQGGISVIETLTDFVRPGWELACPSPLTGSLQKGYYNAGSGLKDDVTRESNEFSRMQLVTDITEAEYTEYLEQVKAAGYTQILDNKIEKNLFAEFTKDGLSYHVTYLPKDKQMRVTEDRAGVPLSEFAYDTKGEKQTQIYQYGLYYDPNNEVTSTTVNCGMMYIVRLSDNSLVLVDGGHLHQSSNEAVEGLMAFLHQITGTEKGEKMRVAAWYATHAHGDHVTMMAKICKRYHDELDLERVMYSFPSYQVRSSGYDSNTTTAKAMIRRYYPEVKFLKLHTGQSFNLSDMGVEVLYTHEDAIGVTQFENARKEDGVVKFDFTDYNSSSAVVRFHIDGKSFLLLGDISTEAEKVIVRNFSAQTMKSDVVQAAHHCFNYLNTLYPMIEAPVVFMPQSESSCRRSENLPKLNSILKYVVDDQIYYEAAGTYGFAIVDGEITLIHESAVVGTVYDFSGI